jgi:hypothetical protein
MRMSGSLPVVAFNPRPAIERVALANGHACYVIDDALLDPERLLGWIAAQSTAFRPVDFNAYPGTYLILPQSLNELLQEFFNRHMRGLFDARRLVQMHCRLAMVTLPPQALRPYQWLCHSDNFALEPSHSIQASVLYLFEDAALGGTSFYEPVRSAGETMQLFADSAALDSEAFTRRYGIAPGYMHASNAYFTRIGSVAARWNRLIFYDGSLLHSGDITSPDKLSHDPLKGRLTWNGFFTCRRKAV